MNTTNIVIKLQIEGIHSWPGVLDHPGLEKVHFLSAPHRHTFHITAKKKVAHTDRDVEIIMFKRAIHSYLTRRYYAENAECFYFNTMSCEMIAEELTKYFGLNYCEVLEDGENGAEYICPEPTMSELFAEKDISKLTISEVPKEDKEQMPRTSSTSGPVEKINYVYKSEK
jgi:hypothetical protein